MCSTCGKSVVSPQILKSNTNIKSSSNCQYTKEQLSNWRDKILCITTKNLYTEVGIIKSDINRFLGVLNSVVIYNNNPCYFLKELPVIYDAVLKIIDSELCL